MASKINYIEVYSFYNDLDASVIETLMRGFNINCAVKTIGMHSFSFALGEEFPEKRIAIEEDKVELARMVINNAIKNGVLSKEGRFVS